MQSAAAGVDVWLRNGGRVVAASERAARALAAEFHRARRAEGLTAWPVPTIEPWGEFVRGAWEASCATDGRLVMNPAQETALWTQIISRSRHGESLMEGPLRRLSTMAAAAHGLVCAYAPDLLRQSARSNWQQDAAAFSNWLEEFDRACASAHLASAARLPVELLAALKANRSNREPLLLAGFDRLQPIQSNVLSAWGSWEQVKPGKPAELTQFYEAADELAELSACALWCKQRLDRQQDARLMIITQDLPGRRGEMERALLRSLGEDAAEKIEFSLGVPLAQVPLVRAAHLLLRWLAGSIEEHELDWLLGCGTVTESAETNALTGFMRAIRRKGLQRTHWSCQTFLQQDTAARLPSRWTAQQREALRRVESVASLEQKPIAWAEFVQELLEAAGWPGSRGLTSEEFQALRRWQHALDICASLGFDGRRMKLRDFLEELGRVLNETLFAAEAQDAAVVIAGPAESAGLTADAIWFLGASEEAWPSGGSRNPLIPIGVQQQFQMPHASPQLDWELARIMTARMVTSAPEVYFSYPKQVGGVEMRPSRVIQQIAGQLQQLPDQLRVPGLPSPLIEEVDDVERVPLVDHEISGGSAVLSAQSQCPFKAFASARLGAKGWDRAEAGLNALQRGELLHRVLHNIWAPDGIRNRETLMDIHDLRSFVSAHVQNVLRRDIPASVKERMPEAYLALEELRLTNLVTEWLEYERTRVDFSVEDTEVEKEVTIAGIRLTLRLDRVDRLKDGSRLVVDYKTGNVKVNAWELPRPEDVQLPLYAGFALNRETEPVGGLVFAKVRTGKHEIVGRVGDAEQTLFAAGYERKLLVTRPLTIQVLENWRSYIEKMASDFLSGDATVNPIDPDKTCCNCDLHTLCRIAENAAHFEEADQEMETGDE